jgi:dolichol-phosphate mannosyltransferase
MPTLPSQAEPAPAAHSTSRAPSEESSSEERGALAAAAALAWELVRRIHLGTRKPGNWVQLVKFGIVGGTGYVVNLAVFAALVKAAGIHHIVAAILAFCVAVTNNFLWNRGWTFRGTTGHAGFQAARFLVVSLVGLGVNLIVLALLADVVGMGDIPAQAISVAVAMPVNFIGNKLWTFR